MQREITRELVRRLLPGRMAESNKGSYGSVLAAAGSMAYRPAEKDHAFCCCQNFL